MAIGRLIGGVVVAGAGMVGLGYSGLAGQDDTVRDETGAITEGGDLGAFRIKVGDCFGGMDAVEVESVEGISCADPHEYEVYFAFNLAGDVYPGEVAIGQETEEKCVAAFEDFVGVPYNDSALYYSSMYPTTGSWNELDDREVLCLVLSGDETPLIGSMEGAKY